MTVASSSSPTQEAAGVQLRFVLAWLLLLLPILATFLIPTAYPALLFLPLLAVALVLPPSAERGWRRFFLMAWGSTLAVGLLAWWRVPAPQASPSLGLILLLLTLVTIILALLWQASQHSLRLAWADASLPQLEREVEERSHALRRLLLDIEARAVAQKRLLEEVNQRTRELTLLNEINDVYRSSRTLEEAQGRIAPLVKELFQGVRGALGVKGESRTLHTAVAWGEISSETEFEEDDCWALRKGQEHLVTVREPDPARLCNHLPFTGSAEYLCIPLKTQGQTLGILHLRSETNGTLSPDTLRLARIAAEQAGLVLANLRLQEIQRSQSVRDSLTGLYNRRYMEESLKREVRRISRSQQPLGIIMIDIDRLREFNEKLGYDAGDDLLRQFGAILQESVRGGDIASRYSGEEFMIIMPGAPAHVTRQRSEQLRDRFLKLKAQQGCIPAERATLSIGIASFPHDGMSDETLIRSASAALSRAKAAGGNHVMETEGASWK